MPEDRVTTSGGDAQRAIGWTIAGLGLATFAAGTYFGIKWIDDYDRANSRCAPMCDAAGAGFRDDARSNGSAAAGLIGGGAAAMIVGAALVASAPGARVVRQAARSGLTASRAVPRPPQARRATPTVRVAPTAGPGGGGVVVLGTW
jgi:hypothetical protein